MRCSGVLFKMAENLNNFIGLKCIIAYGIATTIFFYFCFKYENVIKETVLSTTKDWDIPTYELTANQKSRLKLLKNYCTKESTTHNLLKFTRAKTNKGQLYLSHEKRFLYCSVPKVASTNWKRIILYVEGKIESISSEIAKNKIHELPQTRLFSILSKGERSNVLRKYFKFFFVRHPFERLVSAFRNKFQNNSYFERNYGKHILSRYRKNITKGELERGKGVTFSEFIQWTIDVHVLDPHWMPVFSLCYPCFLPYDYIGKMETLIGDSKEILSIVRADGVQFPANLTDGYKVSSEELMNKYFLEIPTINIKKLYKMYEADFVAFDYTVPENLLN